MNGPEKKVCESREELKGESQRGALSNVKSPKAKRVRTICYRPTGVGGKGGGYSNGFRWVFSGGQDRNLTSKKQIGDTEDPRGPP